MKKKQTKHFVPNKTKGVSGSGIPACNCFNYWECPLPAWVGFGEVARTRAGVTCKNCQKTKVFRKIR